MFIHGSMYSGCVVPVLLPRFHGRDQSRKRLWHLGPWVNVLRLYGACPLAAHSQPGLTSFASMAFSSLCSLIPAAWCPCSSCVFTAKLNIDCIYGMFISDVTSSYLVCSQHIWQQPENGNRLKTALRSLCRHDQATRLSDVSRMTASRSAITVSPAMVR